MVTDCKELVTVIRHLHEGWSSYRIGERTMSVILFVRFGTNLAWDELARRLLERRPRFLEVPGLIQKIYGRDPITGDICGVYFFESQDALAAFRDTKLAKTIPEAYESTDVRREVFEVLYPLRPDVGPISDARDVG